MTSPSAYTTGGKDSGDVSRRTELIVVLWILAAVAAVILGCSLYVKAIILRRVRVSDYVMIMAFVSGVIHNSLVTEGTRWGLGRHLYYLNEEQKMQARKILFMCEGWGTVSPTFGRIAFCFFLLSFAVTRSETWPLRTMIGAQVVVNSIMIAVIYAQCGSHVSAFWDPTIKADCWNSSVHRDYSYFQCSWNSLTDLVLSILPVIMLWKLKLELNKKIAVIALFCLSIVALIASIMKAYVVKEVAAWDDLTWDMVPLIALSAAETFIIIIAATIPTLKPLIRWGRQPSNLVGEEAQSSRPRRTPDTGSWRQWGALSFMNTASSQSQHIPEPGEGLALETKPYVPP